MISSETLSTYLDRLASREPTPGGGAAAAVSAAQAAALIGMVARYTTGSRYEQHAAAVQEIIEASEQLGRKALSLAEADEQAFRQVIDSYKLPAGTEEEKSARTEAVDSALVGAAEVPAALLLLARRAVETAAELSGIANPMVISDVAAAAAAIRAAVTTAQVNIEVNAAGIADPDAKARLLAETAGLEAQIISAADALAERVRERIRG